MSIRLTNTEFIFKSMLYHGGRYDYSKLDYINELTKVTIICKDHGDYQQKPSVHYRAGCPKCGLIKRATSRKNDVNKLISKFKPKDYRQWKIENFYIDGIDLENNIIYEFYGDFWHGNPEVYKQEDINCVNGIRHGELYRKTIEREDYLKSLGYKIVSIWESEYKKIYKS